ncbi:MAG: prepilin-type N-terminal cleavage/methylation domain-containing protein [Patescibacteria group bacterium]|jgi:prepilin-type N-terminal cleavage/methylation domain-containing protein
MQNRRGFTLIELLVVVAIIGILATVVVINLTTAQKKARDAKRISDIESVATAARLYKLDNGTYPAKDDSCGGRGATDWCYYGAQYIQGNNTHGHLGTGNILADNFRNYISVLPTDPTNRNIAFKYIYNNNLGPSNGIVIRAWLETTAGNYGDKTCYGQFLETKPEWGNSVQDGGWNLGGKTDCDVPTIIDQPGWIL